MAMEQKHLNKPAKKTHTGEQGWYENKGNVKRQGIFSAFSMFAKNAYKDNTKLFDHSYSWT